MELRKRRMSPGECMFEVLDRQRTNVAFDASHPSALQDPESKVAVLRNEASSYFGGSESISTHLWMSGMPLGGSWFKGHNHSNWQEYGCVINCQIFSEFEDFQ